MDIISRKTAIIWCERMCALHCLTPDAISDQIKLLKLQLLYTSTDLVDTRNDLKAALGYLSAERKRFKDKYILGCSSSKK